jgi:DNA replication protein DnaC
MNEVTTLLQELKLYGIKEAIDYRLTEAIQSNLSFQEFLLMILSDEKIYKQNARSERLRKRAHFRDKVYLEEFEASSKRGVSRSSIQQFKSFSFIRNNENLLLIGGTGGGKTFLAQAIGNSACLAGFESIFISVNNLFREVASAEASGKYLSYLKKLRRTKLLILDDFGLRNYTHLEATILLDILEERYRKTSLIITSQVKPQGWKSLFEDEVIAEAILDRIESCAHTIKLKGDSYRKHHKVKKYLENND